MKKTLAKKITLSILAGAMLMSSSVAWAAITEGSATGTTAIAIGTGAEAKGAYSNAIGYNAKASGNYSHAFGTGAKASSFDSLAVGLDANASGEFSLAIGSEAAASGEYSSAIGRRAEAKGKYSVALGAGSLANEENVVSVGDGGAVDGELYPDYRRIINVAAGKNPTDAVNVEQLNEGLARIDLVSDGAADAIAGINQRLDKTNAKINKVVAGAAALAALHPLEYDPDDKLTFSAGMGNYSGENAAALGAFYRPNEKFMVSLGGTMGNGENMVNLGLSIGLDKPNGFAQMSKRELIQEVTSVKAENETMKAEMAEMKALLQELLAKK